MAINWSIGQQQPNALAMMLQGFEEGKQMRREEAGRNAMARIMGAGQTPGIGDGQAPQDMTADWDAVGQWKPELAYQLRGQIQRRDADARKTQNEGLLQLGRLLNNARDETSYQQSLIAARQLGMDVSRAPANFDQSWVDQQKMIVSAFEKDGEQQISGLARELQDAGYQPGTRQFQEAMITALSGKYGAESYDPQTGLVTRSALPMPKAQTDKPVAQIIPQRPPGMTDEDLFRMGREAVAAGADCNTVFEQLQAWGVKP